MLKKGDKIGSYIVEKEIGKGTYGIVYLAFHAISRSAVAIKLLNTEYIDDDEHAHFRNRFLEEALLLKRLKHSNILPYLDDGFYQGTPYLVAQYAQSTLKMLIQKQAPLSVERT